MALSAQGRLTATSCLTTGPSWAANAARLRELPIDAGLHLNFTEAFTDNALNLPLPALIRACYLRRLPKSRLAEQIERQCDAFERHFGRAPDFVDGHQHVHQLPMIRDALLPILARRYAGQPLWLRRTAAPTALPATLPAFRLKAFVIAALGSRRFAALAEAGGWRMNGRLLGVYDFSSDADGYAQLLRGWLQAANDGDLLMCHPAIAGAALTQPCCDAIAAQRPVEFGILADPRVDAWCSAAGVRLVRLSAMLSELH